MKILCPHCNRALPDIVMKGKESFSCPYCTKEILASQLLKHNMAVLSYLSRHMPGTFQQLSAVVKSPPGRKIKIEMPEHHRMLIRIYGPNWMGACFFLFFALIWNAAMVAPFTALFMSGKIEIWWGVLLLVFLMILVWPVGIGTLLATVFFLVGRTEVSLGPDQCRMRKKLFHFKWGGQIPTENIAEVTFNGSTVSIRGDRRTLDFAAGLSYIENTWLILVIQSFLDIIGEHPAD